jgi:hypothetical protein
MKSLSRVIQRDAVVDAALGDQGIAEAGFASAGENGGPQRAGALPVPVLTSSMGRS